MSTRNKVLGLLSDGGFHSGTKLGQKLGVSRAAINKAIKSLSDAGIDIHRVSGRGYRLAEPMRPLQKHSILQHLTGSTMEFEDRLHIFDTIDSTSGFLISQPVAEHKQGAVCIAEFQSGGRGRRDRSWVSTPYSNIMMSMSWRYDQGPAFVGGLSLAAGVAVIKALRLFGVSDVGLKWPNDILWNGRKLAGLLLDVQGEADGPSRVVVGLGVNVLIGEKDAPTIDQPWVDLRTILDEAVDRNRLAAIIVSELQKMFLTFGASGLNAFLQSWQEAHVYHGKNVRLLRGNEVLEGIVEGVEASGAIKLRDATGRVNVYHSGEVSLRPETRESAD